MEVLVPMPESVVSDPTALHFRSPLAWTKDGKRHMQPS